MKFGIGQPVRRVEDRRFVTGKGQYIDDIVLPRMAHGVVVYSPYAHARLISVDTREAQAAPGVLAVLTGADVVKEGLGGLPPLFMLSDIGGPPGYATKRPILISERIRCVGDRIAFVVAETADQARDAAEMITLHVEQLPPIVDLDAAIGPDAPLVWDDCPANTCFTLAFGDPEAVQKVFDEAPHKVAVRHRNNRVSANPIEPRGAIGDYNAGDETFTLHTSSQNPHGVRHMVAASVFGISESRVRVISPDVGGGFGMKADCYPEDALVLMASRRLGRPVKWIATRSESLMSDTHGRDQVMNAELAFNAEGRALALRVKALHGLGAYVQSASLAPVFYSMRMLPGLYDIPVIDISTRPVFTNCSPTGPYRGAGRPEATYVLERLMDEAAREIGMDRAEIRRRNLIPASAMPYHTPTHAIYDSGDFVQMLDRCLALADWDGYGARAEQTRAKGLLRGRAVTCYIESAGVFNERMELRFDPDGNATIVAGTHSHGQGHATVFAQLVHEWLGVPFEGIRYVQGDTDKVPIGRGTYAARSSMLGGTALRAACDAAIAKARIMAAQRLETAPDDLVFNDGMFRAEQTNKAMSFQDAARLFFIPVGLPAGLSVGFETSGSAGGEFNNYPNGAHVCEVEVDPETGAVRIDRYSVIDDVGRALNPLICEGQILGGIAQGIGQALVENIVYDPESGQLLSGSFADYGMPRSTTMPRIKSELAEIPCKTNPLGVKGAGESGTIGAPPSLVNAVLDAVAPLGVRHLEMPLSPGRVWEAIRAAKGAAA